MSHYVNFTKEQLYKAAHTDIKSWLEAKGEKVLKSGSEWMWEANQSVKIRGYIFYDHNNPEDKGTAINFLCTYYNTNFQDAVYTLLGDDYAGSELRRSEVIPRKKKTFALPKANRTMQRIYAYLMQERCIDDEIITFFVHQRTLYESYGTHNCVFVGRDPSGKAKSAHQRGTLSDRPYRGDVDGSSKDYFFNLYGSSGKLYVFEAPIDMLSFITLHKELNWRQHSYLALGGLSDRALERFLADHPDIHEIVFCLDNDFNAKEKDGSPAPNHGQVMAKRYCDKYTQKDYSTLIYIPKQKDWNDMLKLQKHAVFSEV
jgi:hypothetical protein